MPFTLRNMEEEKLDPVVLEITKEVVRMIAKYGGSYRGAAIVNRFMEVLNEYEPKPFNLSE